MNSTISYYNENAEQFINLTKDVDMSQLYRLFEVSIPCGGTILDVGCGSGRDSKYFVDNGYIVTAIDGSEVLCKAASKYVGIDVCQTAHCGRRKLHFDFGASASPTAQSCG